MAEFNPFEQGAIPEVTQPEEFDPFKAGAIPEQPEGGFDPFKAGAIPETPEPAEDNPTWISDPVQLQEIATIAAKHGIDNPDAIKSLITHAYLKGGTVQDQTKPLEYAVGLASNIALPGDIPAFIQKKMQGDEKTRLAMDDIAKLVEAKESTARKVGTFVAGIPIPMAGVGKVAKLGTAVAEGATGRILGGALAGATIGGIGGAVESQEGKELESGLTGAALGGVLGGTLGAVGEWITKAQTERADKVRQIVQNAVGPDDSVIKRIDDEFAATFTKGSERELDTLADPAFLEQKFSKGVPQSVQQERKEFVDFVRPGAARGKSPEEIDAQIRGIIHDHGAQGAAQKYENFRYQQVADVATDKAIIDGLETYRTGVLDRIAGWAKPAMYLANKVDKLTGSKFNTYINEISNKQNLFKNTSAELIGKLTPITQEMVQKAKAANIPLNVYQTAIYDTLNGKVPEVKVDKALVDNFRNYFEDLRQTYNSIKGEEVIKRWTGEGEEPSYITHKPMDMVKAIDAIQNKLIYLEDNIPEFKAAVSQIGKKAVDLTPLMENQEIADVVKAIEIVSGKEMKTANELVRTVDDIVRSPADAMRISEMSARAARGRTGGTPEFILEKNVVKLAEDWVMNSIKEAYLGHATSLMKRDLMALAKAGVDKRYIEDIGNLVQDIELGHRPDTLATAISDAMVGMQLKARKAAINANREGKTWKAGIYNMISKSPEVMTYLGNQVYPNVLGALTNPTSPLKNLMQPFMMTSPEVGYRYAIPEVVRAMAKAAKNPNAVEEELKAAGLHGEAWEKIMNSVITDTESGKAWRTAKRLNHEAMEWNMKLFSKSEVFNRYAAYKLGQKTSGDMIDAVKNTGKLDFKQTTAMDYINNMMESEKRHVIEILQRATDAEGPALEAIRKELDKVVAQNLIQKTVFDYNKANASIIARYMPAPMIVFTKFPTYLAGNIIHEWESKGFFGAMPMLTRNYLAPFVVMAQTDELADEMLGDDNILDWVYGKQGLKGTTNLGGISGFRAFGNPIAAAPFKIVGKAGEAAIDFIGGDTEAAGKAIESVPKEIGKTLGIYAPTVLSSPIRMFMKLAEQSEE